MLLPEWDSIVLYINCSPDTRYTAQLGKPEGSASAFQTFFTMNGHSPQSAPDDIASFIYHSGFLQANFADSQLLLHNSSKPFPTYSLHALIVARSPKLFDQLKRAAGPPYQLHLEASDPNLTVEGLNLAMGSLYSGRREVPSSLSMGILAASNLLQLEELGRIAWDRCLDYFKTPAGVQEGINFALSSMPKNISGLSSPTLAYEGPYPQYTKNLLADLLKYVIETLDTPQSESVLTTLPFELLKTVLESPELKMSSMERHNFARQVVSKRKPCLEPGVEESVVMAFGTDSKSGGIEVLRKDKSTKKKALWKAGTMPRS